MAAAAAAAATSAAAATAAPVSSSGESRLGIGHLSAAFFTNQRSSVTGSGSGIGAGSSNSGKFILSGPDGRGGKCKVLRPLSVVQVSELP